MQESAYRRRVFETFNPLLNRFKLFFLLAKVTRKLNVASKLMVSRLMVVSEAARRIAKFLSPSMQTLAMVGTSTTLSETGSQVLLVTVTVKLSISVE
jgi:hypothetical protein